MRAYGLACAELFIQKQAKYFKYNQSLSMITTAKLHLDGMVENKTLYLKPDFIL